MLKEAFIKSKNEVRIVCLLVRLIISSIFTEEWGVIANPNERSISAVIIDNINQRRKNLF